MVSCPLEWASVLLPWLLSSSSSLSLVLLALRVLRKDYLVLILCKGFSSLVGCGGIEPLAISYGFTDREGSQAQVTPLIGAK